MNLKFLWIQNRLYTAVTLSVLISAFLCLPPLKAIKVKNFEWNNLKSRLSAAQVELKACKECVIIRKFTKRQDIPSLIDDITREGRALKINFKSISQKEIIDSKDRYLVLPVQMEIEGGYEDIGRYLGALENKNSILTVEGLEIERDKKILPKVPASLAINLYLEKE